MKFWIVCILAAVACVALAEEYKPQETGVHELEEDWDLDNVFSLNDEYQQGEVEAEVEAEEEAGQCRNRSCNKRCLARGKGKGYCKSDTCWCERK